MNNLVTEWITDNFINLIHVLKRTIDERTTTRTFYLELKSNWAIYKDPEQELIEDDVSVKVVNNLCFLNGYIYNTKVSTLMFVLPEEARPEATKEIMCLTEHGVDSIIIRKTGECIFMNRTKSRLVNLSSISYHK